MPPGIYVYTCPDGVNRSLYPDRRDCPGYDGSPTRIDTGGASGRRTRFLGARRRFIPLSELTGEYLPAVEKPGPIDRRRIVILGLAAFSLAWLLFLAARRRGKR